MKSRVEWARSRRDTPRRDEGRPLWAECSLSYNKMLSNPARARSNARAQAGDRALTRGACASEMLPARAFAPRETQFIPVLSCLKSGRGTLRTSARLKFKEIRKTASCFANACAAAPTPFPATRQSRQSPFYSTCSAATERREAIASIDCWLLNAAAGSDGLLPAACWCSKEQYDSYRRTRRGSQEIRASNNSSGEV